MTLPFPAGGACVSVPPARQERFVTQDTLQDWLSAFRPRAQAAGISADTLDLALKSVGLRDDVLE